MLKKIIIFLLPLLFIITLGCNNTKNDKNIFQKKQICINYKNEIENYIQNNYDDYRKVIDVFYSPIKDSCLYIIKKWREKNVIDYLSNTDILTNHCENEKWNIIECIKNEEKFNKKIKKLKWE